MAKYPRIKSSEILLRDNYDNNVIAAAIQYLLTN